MDQRAIECLHAFGHLPGGGKGLAAARLDASVETEQRHHSIADELVDPPARCLDCMAGLGKIAIEQEYEIVRQFPFGELSEGPQVGEQDRNLAFGAVQIAGTAESGARLGAGRQERRYAQIPLWAQLTGKPHVGRGANAAQHFHLFGGRRQECVLRSIDLNPAGGAASTPAADRGVRDAGHSTRLQYRHAAHDLHNAAARIGQAHDAAPALPARTCEPRSQHGNKRSHERVAYPHHHFVNAGGVRRRRAGMLLRELRDPCWIFRERSDLSATLEEAEDRQGRQQ